LKIFQDTGLVLDSFLFPTKKYTLVVSRNYFHRKIFAYILMIIPIEPDE
jgi:hypothetical protein